MLIRLVLTNCLTSLVQRRNAGRLCIGQWGLLFLISTTDKRPPPRAAPARLLGRCGGWVGGWWVGGWGVGTHRQPMHDGGWLRESSMLKSTWLHVVGTYYI